MTYGRPVIVDGATAELLQSVSLRASDGSRYSESWLQQLLYRHPESLPVEDIEATFTPLIPVCVELATPSGGYIDILFVTPQGRLVGQIDAAHTARPQLAQHSVVRQLAGNVQVPLAVENRSGVRRRR